MTIYRITIVNTSAHTTIYEGRYHTTEQGCYKEAIDKGWITEGEPIDKDWQIVPDTKILITD